MLGTVVYLIITIFQSGLGNQPITQVLRAPSAEACEAKAAEINGATIADPRIVGVDARCVVVPAKQGV